MLLVVGDDDVDVVVVVDDVDDVYVVVVDDVDDVDVVVVEKGGGGAIDSVVKIHFCITLLLITLSLSMLVFYVMVEGF